MKEKAPDEKKVAEFPVPKPSSKRHETVSIPFQLNFDLIRGECNIAHFLTIGMPHDFM